MPLDAVNVRHAETKSGKIAVKVINHHGDEIDFSRASSAMPTESRSFAGEHANWLPQTVTTFDTPPAAFSRSRANVFERVVLSTDRGGSTRETAISLPAVV
jgi:hypothetical protein